MVLFSLVATHADIDLETVARLSAGSAAVSSSTVVLATCNRFEIYSAAENPATARTEMEATLAHATGFAPSLVSSSFKLLTGPDVAKHLFAVASGLDSAVVGEREIAGQVRRALIDAQTAFPVPGPLVRLFQTASRTAKDVGSQTALGSQGRSIVSVALDLAGDSSATAWDQRKAVVFGTGAYAGVTMALLRERGVSDLSVYSSSGRAADFVASRGGTAAQSLEEALGSADLVIGCSGSDQRVSAETLADIRRRSGTAGEPLSVIDLALSRDFDPAITELPGVELLTLETVRLAAPSEQESALQQAQVIVSQAAADFELSIATRSVDTAIVALRKHTMAVLDAEMERVRAQHGCTAAAEEVEFALRRMVKQLLHGPTVRARELTAAGQQAEYIAALQALYGIELESPTPAAQPVESIPAVEPASCPADHNAADRSQSA